MIPRPSIARDSGQLDPWCSTTDIPPPQSATLGLHPVARKLLLISRHVEGRRLSWPEHTCRLTACSRLLARAKSPGRDSHSQCESYECDTLPLDHLHLQRHMGVNNLPRVVTGQCASRELNLQPLDYKSNTLPLHYRALGLITRGNNVSR